MMNDNVVTYRPNAEEFRDFSKFVSDASKNHSNHCWVIIIIPPTKQRDNYDLVKKILETKSKCIGRGRRAFTKAAQIVACYARKFYCQKRETCSLKNGLAHMMT
jgi:hypothetical protein